MKKRIFHLMVFLAVMCTDAVAEHSAVSVQPLGVRINYEDYGGTSGKKQGVELGFFFKLEGEGDERIKAYEWIKWSGDQVRNVWKDLLFKDSNIKIFGPCIKVRAYTDGEYPAEERKELAYIFIFDQLPAPNVDWIRVTGEVPVELLSETRQTPFVPLLPEKNAKAETGPFEIRIHEVEESWENRDEYDIDFKPILRSGEYYIDELVFKDHEGNPIERKHGVGGYQYYDKRIDGIINYTFPDLPTEMSVSVIYRDIKRVMVPVDVKFELYPSEGANK